MDTFDLDLESLDLKTIDLGEPKKTTNGSSSMSFDLSGGLGGGRSSNGRSPDLSVSTNNNDMMPPDIFGNSLDDDLGLSMIVNKDKLRPDDSSSTTSFSGRNATHNTSSSDAVSNADDILRDIGIDIGGNDILGGSNFDNMTNIDLDRDTKQNDNNGSMNGPSIPNFNNTSSSTGGSGLNGGSPFTNTNAFNSMPSSGGSQMSFEDMQKAKFDLLCKFERLRSKGVRIPQTFSMSSDYDEMKYEYDRLLHQRKMDNSVKMQRRMLMSFVTGVEYLNNKFDPFDLQLDDWSENVHENADEYDDIFEDLYEKYKDSADMAPELRLMFALSGSAFMYHLQNTMFKAFYECI